MVDALTPMLAFIDDCTVSVIKAFLFCSFSANNHHVTEKCCMSFFSFRYSSQSITIFGNNQKVSLRLRCDVAECQTDIVFVDYGGRNLFCNNLVENCYFFWFCRLSFLFFILIIRGFWISENIQGVEQVHKCFLIFFCMVHLLFNCFDFNIKIEKVVTTIAIAPIVIIHIFVKHLFEFFDLL